MAIPYYRFFPGDYARDTRHLSLMQHGVYRLLIDLYMDQGKPLRNDLQYLYRWVHAESVEERNAVEVILGDFFVLGPDGWSHKRCEREIAWRMEQSAAGKRAVMTRENNRLANVDRSMNDRLSNQNQNQNQNQITTKVKTPLSGSAPNGAEHRRLALDVLDYLNTSAGKRFRPVDANIKLIIARLREGYTAEELKTVVCRQVMLWSEDPKMMEYLRPATLFNATRCAQYAGELEVQA